VTRSTKEGRREKNVQNRYLSQRRIYALRNVVAVAPTTSYLSLWIIPDDGIEEGRTIQCKFEAVLQPYLRSIWKTEHKFSGGQVESFQEKGC
jgi:hypothetical protein